jgi:hypothetical protein
MASVNTDGWQQRRANRLRRTEEVGYLTIFFGLAVVTIGTLWVGTADFFVIYGHRWANEYLHQGVLVFLAGVFITLVGTVLYQGPDFRRYATPRKYRNM